MSLITSNLEYVLWLDGKQNEQQSLYLREPTEPKVQINCFLLIGQQLKQFHSTLGDKILVFFQCRRGECTIPEFTTTCVFALVGCSNERRNSRVKCTSFPICKPDSTNINNQV